MRILLDTHIALWAITGNSKLSGSAKALMLGANDVYVSAASVWEISIKHAIARAQMPISGTQALAEFRTAGFTMLSIRVEHAAAADTLPSLHQDPFDRMLIAQAMYEPLHLLTHDRVLAAYSELVVLV
jgi:PIN domain nuclease of toxin-antitoxin system